MKKHDEISNLNSCFNKARQDELLFVLLGRDAAAPVAIRAWVAERIRLGKNRTEDPKISEALGCAERMEIERIDARLPGVPGIDAASHRTAFGDDRAAK